MVLDPESLQLYRSGLLGADPGNTPAFRVNFQWNFFMVSNTYILLLQVPGLDDNVPPALSDHYRTSFHRGI
jgi:hypothetical protein